MRARHVVAAATAVLLGGAVVVAGTAGAQTAPTAASAADLVVTVVGDLCGTSCDQTADLATAMNPDAVITLGDNAYENGTLSEYNNSYDPYWGKFKSITYPSVGNHEYQTSNASGYFDYYNGVGQANGRAGERGKGYYSYDLGDWHFIALNTNIAVTAGSAQEQWLRADLAANTKKCTAAYMHHPRFSRGDHGSSTKPQPLWQALYDAKADLVLAGHDHNYQRFAPMKPDGTLDTANGLRQLLVGTGGRGLYGFNQTAPNFEVGNDSTLGVVKLTLKPTGFRYDFVPVEGRTFTDSGEGTCHKAAGSTPTPTSSPTASPTPTPTPTGTPGVGFTDDFETDKGWTVNPAGSDTATSGKWERGDPEATTDNGAKQLGTTTSGSNSLVTGRLAGSSANANDVDGGVTSIRSPAFSVTSATSSLSFRYNFAHSSSNSDYLRVKVVGATTSTVFEKVANGSDTDGVWQTGTADLSAFVGQNVRLLVEAADPGGNSLAEAQIDDVRTAGSGRQTFTNTTAYPIPDNGTVDSPIAVTGVPGQASTAVSVSVDITHPYRGDLQLDLIAPDGTAYRLKNADSDSGDNVVATYTVNAATETANGTWILRARDTAAQDVGRINNWRITLP